MRALRRISDPTIRRRVAARIAPPLDIAAIFPTIEAELGTYRHLFKGNVLNAGAGNRDVAALVEGRLFNQ